MSKRYIDADNYKKDLIQLGFLPALVVSVLDKQPTADVVELRHAYFIKHRDKFGYYQYECSECHTLHNKTYIRFCSECGAKMDGEKGKTK